MQNSGSEKAVTSSNFKIYLDGKEVPFTSVVTERGYLWKSIRLVAAERYLDANNRWSHRNYTDLDNGKPYGLAFQGFTRKDIDERKIDNGGWIANDQPVGENALEMGTYVGLEDAIRDYGAGLAGKVEVAYVGGGDDVLDWARQRACGRAKSMPYSNRGSVMFTGPLLQAFMFTSTPR